MTARHSLTSRQHGSPRRAWSNLGGRLIRRLREANAAQAELYERLALRQEPWLEDFMHWSYDGEQWHLHGRYLPRPGGRPSVTRSGWCPHLSVSGASSLDSPSACGG